MDLTAGAGASAARSCGWAERWLVARGVWKLRLTLRENNVAAQRFYERLGYRDLNTGCIQKVIG